MAETGIINSVEEGNNGYYIHSNNGSFFFQKKYGVIPKENDEITIYMVRGFMVRGVDLNGKRVYYKTDEDLERERIEYIKEQDKKKEKEFKKNKKKMDKEFNKLPLCFQLRIKRFRRGNKKFRVEYEPYEMFVCKDAIKIAKHCKTAKNVKKFSKLNYKEQLEVMSNEHSGNTAGAAINLAYWYLEDQEMVIKSHGALTSLVGCEEYGCIHNFEELEQLSIRKLLIEKNI